MTDATKPEERDMKLRYSPTSPFVRKVLIAAYEVGLEDKIEKISTDPWAADTDLRADNPLSKVPCLVTDEGETIFDSLVICEYLNTMGNGSLFPTDIQARFKALTLAAAADGTLDAGVLCVVETLRRPEELRWKWWLDRQTANMNGGLDLVEKSAGDLKAEGPITIAEVTLGGGLDWLDLRFPDFDWRKGRPGLTEWHAAASERPSFKATLPPKP